MARETSLIGRALDELKSVTKSDAASSGLAEKIVPIPEVNVYSEIPFAHLGTLNTLKPALEEEGAPCPEKTSRAAPKATKKATTRKTARKKSSR